MRLRSIPYFELVCACAMLVAVACETVVNPPGQKPQQTRTPPPNDKRVVILVIDGPRHTETFGDPTHQYIPHMWNTLRPNGTLFSNFRNLGITQTNPGHAALLTGAWQNIDNDGLLRPTSPTLFEYYRKYTGHAASETWLVSGKLKASALTYSAHPNYGPAYSAASDLDFQSDYETYDHLIQHLDQDAPRLVMCSFSRVDQAGHSGVWDDYLNEIETADSLAALTWNYLENDPDYAGKTYLFITADHGRHDDAHGGFQEHGDSCEGCRHIFLLALGPNVRAGDEITSSQYTQRDLCLTIGQILGFPTPYTAGFTLLPIFEATPTGVLH